MESFRRLSAEVQPAPDEWDRRYNVDFFIQIEDQYIGIQIKPVSFEEFDHDRRWEKTQLESHRKFYEARGGKVFTVFSTKVEGKKQIANPEVVSLILDEIKRLTARTLP